MKIDIVYLWVNGSDEKWNKKRREKAKILKHLLSEANDDTRFMDNDELRYSLRSIERFAPWINNIFIVTDDQTPDWLNTDHPKITLVDHKEIFTDTSCLPTFSARGIESRIHHIRGLSEHFIYFNDDMFLGNHCTPGHFFTGKGLPRIFVSEIIPIPNRTSFDISKRAADRRNSHQYAIVNTRKLIRAKYGKSVHYNIRHGIKPLLKSVLSDLENIFGPELAKTSRNSFRTNDDILIFNLFAYYAIVKKLGKPRYLKTVSKKSSPLSRLFGLRSDYTFGFINLHDTNVDFNLAKILERKPLVMCLNQTPASPPENIDKVKNFLPKMFPAASSFEKM